MRSPGSAAVLAILAACMLTACAPTANPLAGEAAAALEPAGFFRGWWHGFTLVFTFIISLFSDSVGVYEVHNSGWPYNLGYLFGVMMFFGGGGGASSRRKK